jgi:hypothetical protein
MKVDLLFPLTGICISVAGLLILRVAVVGNHAMQFAVVSLAWYAAGLAAIRHVIRKADVGDL